ncbi:MAG TPA: hypothetical protein VF618_11660 [Thermoanaerobaculia bacterium]
MSPSLLLIAPPRRAAFAEALARRLPLELLRAGTAAKRAGMDVTLFDAHNREDGLEAIRFILNYQQPDSIVIPRDADAGELAALAQEAAIDATIFAATASEDEPSYELVDWSLYRHHAIEGSRFASVDSAETLRMLREQYAVNVFHVTSAALIDGSASFIASLTADEVLRRELAPLRKAGLLHVRLDRDDADAIDALRAAGIVSEVLSDGTTSADLAELTTDEAYRDFYSARARSLEDAPHDYRFACVQAVLRSAFFTERMRRLVPATLAPRKNRGHLALV